jgi:hypothetical protein
MSGVTHVREINIVLNVMKNCSFIEKLDISEGVSK